MRRFNNQWPNTDNAKLYKFFAEICLELVDDRSWESYKAYSLSTISKLIELSKACDSVKSGSFGKPALKVMIEECNESLQSDPIASSIVSQNMRVIPSFEISYESTLEEIRSNCRMLISILEPEFKQKAETLITDEIASGKSRIKLFKYTKLYISHLINSGNSKKYVRSCLERIFLDRDIQRCSPSLLRNLFENFSETEFIYSVYCSVNANFARMASRSLSAEILSLDSGEYKKIEGNLPVAFNTTKNSSIIRFDKVPGNNPYAAAELIFNVLRQLESIVFLYPGAVRAHWASDAYVVQSKQNWGVICSADSSFLSHRRNVASVRKTTTYVENLFEVMYKHVRRRDSFAPKLFRSITTAALAEKTESKQAQLVTIWAGFEAILPELGSEDSVRINHFIKYIVPPVVLSYPIDNIIECYSNFGKIFGRQFRDFVSDNGVGSDQASKFLSIIVLGSPVMKKDMCELVSTSPLALNRLWFLESKFSDPKTFSEYIFAHERRVSWQIHRIYRERNLIVHSGATSPFLGSLAENAYNYYSKMISSIESASTLFNSLGVQECLTLIRHFKDENDRLLKGGIHTQGSEAKKKFVLEYVQNRRFINLK
jgi:hypothetical protein